MHDLQAEDVVANDVMGTECQVLMLVETILCSWGQEDSADSMEHDSHRSHPPQDTRGNRHGVHAVLLLPELP